MMRSKVGLWLLLLLSIIAVVVVVKRITVDGQSRRCVIGWRDGARRRHQGLQIMSHHRIRGLNVGRWLLQRCPLFDVVGELHRWHTSGKLPVMGMRFLILLPLWMPCQSTYRLFLFEDVFNLVLPNLVAAKEAIVKVEGCCWRCKNVLLVFCCCCCPLSSK